MPMWRNGRRGRLKIYSWQRGAGSSPAIGKFTGQTLFQEKIESENLA